MTVLSSVEDYVSVETVLDHVVPAVKAGPRKEAVSVHRSFGRVSATNLFAAEDMPPGPVSHMDGYAVSSSDFEGPGKAAPALRVVGEVRLGSLPRARVRPGEAVRVATGSLLPRGADAVVPVEQADLEGRRLKVKGSVEHGQFVFAKGGDLRRGDALLKEGDRVRAQDVALLISAGVQKVAVYAKPRVGVLATGHELTNSWAAVGKVRNSHSPLFLSLLEGLGCAPVDLGIAKDDPATLRGRVRRGLKETDMVLTTGGTSVGRLDVVGEAIRGLRPAVAHHGVRMDRGRVTGVAVVGGKPVVMMPGPIQGAMNAFVVFAVPIARRLSGWAVGPTTVSAKLSRGWEARKRFPNFTKVVYVRLARDGHGWLAEPRLGETESIGLLTGSSGFVVVPEETTSLAAGEVVDVLLLPGYSWAS